MAINKTYTSNTLYNDSTGVIAFAEQLKQELINWANYHHVTEELGPDNRPDTQNALNNLFLSVYERFLTFINDADATEEAINTWKEIENFLADYTDEKTLAEIVAELNANIESRLTVPLESTTGSSTTSTMTQKAITETIDASKIFTTGEKVDNVGIDNEPIANSDNLVKSDGVLNGLNKISKDLSPITGNYTAQFRASTGEHSSTLDYIPVNIANGAAVTIKLSALTATVNYQNIRVVFSNSNKERVYGGIIIDQLGVEQTFNVYGNDISYISFYIYNITKAGVFEAECKTAGNFSRLNTTVNSLVNNKGGYGLLCVNGVLPDISLPNRTFTIPQGTVINANRVGYRPADSGDVVIDLTKATSCIKVTYNTTSNTFSVKTWEAGISMSEVVVLLVYVNYVASGEFTSIYGYSCLTECTLNGNREFALKNDFDDLTGTVNDINTKLGLANYSFSSSIGEHSSNNDLYTIDLKSGETIYGTLSTGTAECDGTSVSVYFKSSVSGAVRSKVISLGEEFSYTAGTNLDSISFYIYRITKAGTFNVTLKLPHGLIASVQTIENNLENVQDVVDENIGIIPSYFSSNIDNVIDNARNDVSDVGMHGENFVFITDMHWENNAKHSPSIIHKLCNSLKIGNVVFGGDAINGQSNQSKAKQYFTEISSKLKGCDSNFLAVMGNHDFNANDGGTAFTYPSDVFYSLFQKNLDYIANHGNSDVYFYIDNPTTNTRFIILNTKHGSTLDSTQLTWFTQLLNNTANDVNIIIFVHIYLIGAAVYDSSVFQGYDYEIAPSGISVKNIVDAAVNNGKNIQCIISGHNHLDCNGMTDTMIPVIGTDCDTRQSLQWPMGLNSKNEQSFDVTTIDYVEKTIKCRRIGRGKSRIIHYDKNILAVGETLDISSLIEIAPTSYSIRDNDSLQYRNAAGGGTGVTYNGTLATISDAGIVTAVAAGLLTAVAENDDCIETFNIKIE